MESSIDDSGEIGLNLIMSPTIIGPYCISIDWFEVNPSDSIHMNLEKFEGVWFLTIFISSIAIMFTIN